MKIKKIEIGNDEWVNDEWVTMNKIMIFLK